MDSDSGIFLNGEAFLVNLRKDEAFLIGTTSLSKIYRVGHDGKFFLFKFLTKILPVGITGIFAQKV